MLPSSPLELATTPLEVAPGRSPSLPQPSAVPLPRNSKTHPSSAASSAATARARPWPCPLGRCHSSSPRGAPFACAQEDPPLLFAPLLQALLQEIKKCSKRCPIILLLHSNSKTRNGAGVARLQQRQGVALLLQWWRWTALASQSLVSVTAARALLSP